MDTFLFITTCCILVVTGCSQEIVKPPNNEAVQYDTNTVLKAFENVTGIRLLGRAKVVNYKKVLGFQDNLNLLLVEIRPSDLVEYFNKSPLKEMSLRSDRSQLLDVRDVEWWKPNGVKKYQSGQVYLKGGSFLIVLVDQDSKDVCKIYFQWGPV